MIDLKLQQNGRGQFDLVLENGDLVAEDNFDSSLITSLFVDTRANRSEVPTPQLRRGWWGDTVSEFINYKLGSKLWLYQQERNTQKTLNSIVNNAYNCLQWLVKYGYLQKVDVTGEQTTQGVKLFITLTAPNGVTDSRSYDLWLATGSNLNT